MQAAPPIVDYPRDTQTSNSIQYVGGKKSCGTHFTRKELNPSFRITDQDLSFGWEFSLVSGKNCKLGHMHSEAVLVATRAQLTARAFSELWAARQRARLVAAWADDAVGPFQIFLREWSEDGQRPLLRRFEAHPEAEGTSRGASQELPDERLEFGNE